VLAANGIDHDELGSGELPHFEEWSTFVKGCDPCSLVIGRR